MQSKVPYKSRGEIKKRQEEVCRDTIANPLKGVFVGGPTFDEARAYLLEIGYTGEEIDELQSQGR